MYEGLLGESTSHTPETCGTAGALERTLTPMSGGTYYLVVPTNGAIEGSHGRTSAGVERPPGAGICLPQVTESCQ